jgi:hypothetical protein
MCEISDVVDIKGRCTLVMCTPYDGDGDFMKAKSITIFDKANRSVEINNFKMEHFTQCWSYSKITPNFGVEEDVGKQYLQKGNRVDFVFD